MEVEATKRESAWLEMMQQVFSRGSNGNLVSQMRFGVLMSRSFGFICTERNYRKENARYFPFNFELFVGQKGIFYRTVNTAPSAAL